MKLNKKGFTLIELLAVVVILLMISTLAISSISSAIERNKAKQDNSKKEVIVSYAKLYYDEHKNSLDSTGKICLGVLDLSDNEIEDSNGDPFGGCIEYTDGKNFKYTESGCSCS